MTVMFIGFGRFLRLGQPFLHVVVVVDVVDDISAARVHARGERTTHLLPSEKR